MLHKATSRINVVFIQNFNNMIQKIKKNAKSHMEAQRSHAEVKGRSDCRQCRKMEWTRNLRNNPHATMSPNFLKSDLNPEKSKQLFIQCQMGNSENTYMQVILVQRCRMYLYMYVVTIKEKEAINFKERIGE